MMLQRRKQAATADDGAPRPKTRVQAESAGATKLKSNGKKADRARRTLAVASVVVVVVGLFYKGPYQQHLRGHVHNMTSNIKHNIEEQISLSPWWAKSDRSTRPGIQAAAKGVEPLYNVVIVPGFVTSGLELWSGELPCSYPMDHRQRVWGGLGMPLAGRNTTCWLEGLSLDPTTGLDRPDVKLRAMRSFDAIDYFVPGYVVWAAVLNMLADIGVGAEVDLMPAPYDWRLPLHLMEHRDGYFSRLKSHIEITYNLNRKKSMVMAHSWGANVVAQFLYWVDSIDPGWVETHIAVYANIAGPLLGVPKSLSPLLSGEVKDLVQLGGLIRTMMDWYVIPEHRSRAFRTWGSAIQMLPVGGRRVWGGVGGAPDDPVDQEDQGAVSFGSVLTVDVPDGDGVCLANSTETQDCGAGGADSTHTVALDVTDALKILLEEGGPFADNIRAWTAPDTLLEVPDALPPTLEGWLRPTPVADAPPTTPPSPPPQGGAQGATEGPLLRPLSPRAKMLLPAKNPLTTPLPNAPSLQIYCLHGVGLATERGYRYTYRQEQGHAVWRLNETSSSAISGNGDADSGPVVTCDGDATVPLVSLGAMCGAPWQSQKLNPGGAQVTIRQYFHKSTTLIGQGPESADHVDVLQNRHFLADVLEIVSGRGGELGNSVHSDVLRIADNVWRGFA